MEEALAISVAGGQKFLRDANGTSIGKHSCNFVYEHDQLLQLNIFKTHSHLPCSFGHFDLKSGAFG